jgi:hypothetical protein
MIDKGEYSIKQIKSYFKYAIFYNKGNADIMTRYANKKINPAYYGKITLGGGSTKPKVLTREEFQKGEPGYVLMDTRTGRLTFYE